MKTYLHVFLGMLFSISLCGQNIDVEKLNELFDHIEHQNQGIGEIAIDKGGKRVFRRRFGPVELTGRSSTGELPLTYRIGSITKMLTATLIYQLCEQGSLSQGDTLGRFYGDLPNAGQITIAHLLSHTSGLEDYAVKEDSLLYWLFKPVTEMEILNEIKRQGVAFDPGERFRYSNTGYYLLTHIIEKVYDRPYAEVFSERIAQPLHLRSTLSGKGDDPVIAPSYELNTKREWSEMQDFYFPNVTGLGDVASTPSDLIKIVRGLFRSELVSLESLKDMKPVGEETFGKGMMRFTASGKVFYGHGGDTFGTSSFVVYNPEDDLSIALSLNGKSISRNEVFKFVSAIMYDSEYRLPDFPKVKQGRVDPIVLSRYEGTYSCQDPALSVVVFRDGDNLKIRLYRQPILMLEAITDLKFFNSVAKCEIEFDRDYQRFFLRQQGQQYEFMRE